MLVILRRFFELRHYSAVRADIQKTLTWVGPLMVAMGQWQLQQMASDRISAGCCFLTRYVVR